MIERALRPTFTLLLTIAVLCGTATLSAQIRLDPWLAYEFGVPLALERDDANVVWCFTCDGTGTSWNHIAWFGMTLRLPELFSNDIDLRANLRLGYSTGRFTSSLYSDSLRVLTGETVSTDRRFVADARGATAGIDATLEGSIGGGMRVGGGLSADHRLFAIVRQTELIVSPADVAYPSGGRDTVMAEGEEIDSDPFSIGLIGTFGKDITLGNALRVSPELFLRCDGWGILNGLGLRSFGAGAGFSFAALPPATPRAAVVVPIPPALPVLSATVDLYAVDESGMRLQQTAVRRVRTLYRLHHPYESEWIAESFREPRIGLSPEIVAEAGVRRWEIVLRRGAEEMARVSSDDRNTRLSIDLGGGEPRAESIDAEFIVEDSTGATYTAVDKLAIDLERGDTSLTDVVDLWIFTGVHRDAHDVDGIGDEVLAQILNESIGAREIVVAPYRSTTPIAGKSVERLAQRLRDRAYDLRDGREITTSETTQDLERSETPAEQGIVVVVRSAPGTLR